MDLKNNYQSFIILEQETNKIKYKENAEKVCASVGISLKSWSNKRATYNQAIKNCIDINKFVSQNSLIEAVASVKGGTKKVMDNGTVQTDIVAMANKNNEKIEIQAVNENEIVALMASKWFKNAMIDIEKSGVSKANFMKAWAKVQTKK